MFSNAQWIQAVAMTLATEGYDPNVVTRELSAYVAGHHYNFAIIQLAIQSEGPPPNPWDYKANYQRARQKWIDTGDLDALLEMIDAVTIDAT